MNKIKCLTNLGRWEEALDILTQRADYLAVSNNSKKVSIWRIWFNLISTIVSEKQNILPLFEFPSWNKLFLFLCRWYHHRALQSGLCCGAHRHFHMEMMMHLLSRTMVRLQASRLSEKPNMLTIGWGLRQLRNPLPVFIQFSDCVVVFYIRGFLREKWVIRWRMMNWSAKWRRLVLVLLGHCTDGMLWIALYSLFR